MNPYELIMIFDPRLGEEKIDHFVVKIEEKIKGAQGEVEKTEKWGTKHLASMIKKVKNLTQGYYVIIKFKSPPNLPAELRALLKVSEQVVRYLLTRAEIFEVPPQEGKDISGLPLAAVNVGEIKGAPLGESQ